MDDANRSIRSMVRRAVTSKILIFGIIALLSIAILVLLILGIVATIREDNAKKGKI